MEPEIFAAVKQSATEAMLMHRITTLEAERDQALYRVVGKYHEVFAAMINQRDRADKLEAERDRLLKFEQLYAEAMEQLSLCSDERDRLRDELAKLRAFIKRQQIYTGCGGWITIHDKDIDAALKESNDGHS